MSVSPLALTACGGGSSSTASAESDKNTSDVTDSFEAISFTSTRIDYEIPGYSANEINAVATGGTDSKIFLTDRDVGNLIITPHQDSLSPDESGANRYFPLIEYTLNEDGISIHRIVDE